MGLINRSRFRDAVLACIAAHGFTDFLSLDGEGLALYTVSFVALRWLSRDARWIPFLIASALHFSRDMRDLEIEERWAAILVIFTALLHCVKQTCVAVWLMQVYLLVVHMPLHYLREPYSFLELSGWSIVGFAIAFRYITSVPSPWYHNLSELDELLITAGVVGHTLNRAKVHGGEPEL